MRFPYSEIRDNLVDEGMMPIDLLRFKLSFFGATHFDPRLTDGCGLACLPARLSPMNCGG